MDSYLLDWVNLLLRWTHVIVGDRLDRLVVLLRLPRHQPDASPPTRRSRPRAWTASCGRCTAAASTTRRSTWWRRRALPEHLHWFYWESYWTWMTGFALFTVLYLFNASSFLVDKNVLRLVGRRRGRPRALGFLVAVLVRLRPHLPQPVGQRAAAATCIVGALVCRVRRRRVVGGLPAVRRPRRLPDGGRDDGHGDERQRLLLDHSRPAQGDRADEGRPAGGPDPRPARQAAQRAQHLLHAAGADRDAVQPLRLAVPGRSTTGWCWC